MMMCHTKYNAVLPNDVIFTRSPYNGERGNAIVMYGCVYVCVCVRVCVCHEVSQTRCGRTLRRIAFVLSSFERSIPLVSGDLRSFAVSRDLDLFIQRRSDPPRRKSRFFHYV